MNGKIKNLIFDFGGVIVDLDREATMAGFADLGVDVSQFLGLSAQKGLFGDLELGQVKAAGFCQRLREQEPVLEGVSDEAIKAAWNRMLVGIPERRLQALLSLGRRYHVALLSNTNEIHVDYSFERHFRAQGYEPETLFEHIYLSNELHLAKPGREIFEEVLRRSGYKPEETLFIDDSEANCEAFAALGVRTLNVRHADEWLGELCPAVASIGFFDGVHRGHCCLMEQVRQEAEERGLDAMLVTFDEHPRSVLHSDYIPELLTSTAEKLQLLRQKGMARIEVLHFTKEMSQLTAPEFMHDILHERLGVRTLVMGYDHRFGRDGGTMEQYTEWGKACGIEVLKAHELASDKVSSSVCRRLLADGDVEEAARLLGHPYILQGTVVSGQQVGHELGFPTANIQPAPHKVIPRRGVYAVWVTIAGDETRHPGMLNIGERPTIDSNRSITIEVNILDFDGDLYGKSLTLEFVRYLRPEQRFDSREALIAQIEHDKQQTLTIMDNQGV